MKGRKTKRLINDLDDRHTYGRKPEYPERMHSDTGKTCRELDLTQQQFKD